jgi:hypothetical protein
MILPGRARGFVMLRAHARHPAGLVSDRWVAAAPGPAGTAGAGACGDGS